MRLDPPELVSVSDKVVLLPACTLPNARLVGVAASAPCVTPVPESGRLKLGFAVGSDTHAARGGAARIRRKKYRERRALAGIQCQRPVQSAQAESCATCCSSRDREA